MKRIWIVVALVGLVNFAPLAIGAPLINLARDKGHWGQVDRLPIGYFGADRDIEHRVRLISDVRGLVAINPISDTNEHFKSNLPLSGLRMSSDVVFDLIFSLYPPESQRELVPWKQYLPQLGRVTAQPVHEPRFSGLEMLSAATGEVTYEANLHTGGRGLADVLHRRLNAKEDAVLSKLRRVREFDVFNCEPRSAPLNESLVTKFVGLDRGVGGAARVADRHQQCDQSQNANHDLDDREAHLQLRGLRHRPLSLEILFSKALLAALGFGACVIAAWGGMLFLDGRRRWHRLAGLAALPLFACVGFTLWGWAVYGYWWSFWAVGWSLGAWLLSA